MDKELCPICQESQCCGTSLAYDLHRQQIELDAWRSGRLTVWHNNTCLEFNVSFNNRTRAFSTIEAAVDALTEGR